MDEARQLEREYLRQLLGQEEAAGNSNEWDQPSELAMAGVSMDSDERVNGLDCSNRNLSGELPSTIFTMSRLLYLHAGSNQFTGRPRDDGFNFPTYLHTPCACHDLCCLMEGVFVLV